MQSYRRRSTPGLGVKLSIGNGTSKLLKLQWEYMVYHKKCLGPGPAYAYYWLDVCQWRPKRLTSCSLPYDNAPTWDCTNATTVPMGTETWIARSSKVIWLGSVSIGGVKADTKQVDSSEHKITFTPDSGEATPNVCGDTDYPLYANRVKERVS